VEGPQRPLELIHARNLLTSLSTAGILMGHEGNIVFYNEAAGALLGRRFEDMGPTSADEWMHVFGPRDESGDPVPWEQQPLTKALQAGRAAHESTEIRAADGCDHTIEASGLPIYGNSGFQGALIFFWRVTD
jgi:PAS domain-containing protein